VYNSIDNQVLMTKKCIESIEKWTTIPYELIVIDDCSKIKYDFSSYKNVRMIFHDKNKGITESWNEGIGLAVNEYICIINNDIVVYDGWIENMIKAYREEEIGFIFPTPIEGEADMKRTYYGTFFDDNVFGPCFLSTRKTYNKLKENNKYFDESMRIWFSDLDMWERARDKDIMLRMTAESFVKHLGSMTVDLIPGFRQVQFLKDKRYYDKKNDQKRIDRENKKIINN
jgi:GT2 family glycosyltransferase